MPVCSSAVQPQFLSYRQYKPSCKPVEAFGNFISPCNYCFNEFLGHHASFSYLCYNTTIFKNCVANCSCGHSHKRYFQVLKVTRDSFIIHKLECY